MTVSEVNNYGFIVQKRRLAELDWSAIPNSFVAGHGTTSIPRHYTFTDAAAVLSPVQYRLNQIDLDRTQHYTEPITLGIPTAVVQQPAYKFLLEQNYPNPFNPTTIIKYQIPSTNHATLSVFDVLGREVATLVNEVKQPGTYTVQWDARLRSANFGGQASMQASGVYFYRLQSGGFVSTKKLMLLR
ncbi:MAG: T9SS type A sorting domain-containing protein [Ignavibacteriae bacterium]|nr:T9SS type A sorting domain-containing protein [Ignavibacteriota bacterium]